MIQIERRVHVLREFLIQTAVSPLIAAGCVVGVALSAIAILQRENGSCAKSSLSVVCTIGLVPSRLFGCVVRFVNPNAPFSAQVDNKVVPSAIPEPSFCHGLTSRKLCLAVSSLYQEPNPLKKYVFSRVLYALSGIVAIITKTADLALGLVAATFAIITLGTQKKLNDFAYNNLTFPLVIYNVIVAVRGLINPAISRYFQDPEELPPAPPLVREPSFTEPPPLKKEKINIPADPLNFVAYDHIPEMLLEDCVLKKYQCATEFVPVRDPVRDPTGGNHIYERAVVVEWLNGHNTSPMTNAPLTVSQLIEMPALKALIDGRLKLHADSLQTKRAFDINAAPDEALQKAADAEYIPD